MPFNRILLFYVYETIIIIIVIILYHAFRQMKRSHNIVIIHRIQNGYAIDFNFLELLYNKSFDRSFAKFNENISIELPPEHDHNQSTTTLHGHQA